MPLNNWTLVLNSTVEVSKQVEKVWSWRAYSKAAIIYSEFLKIFNEAEGWVGVGTYEACKCPLVYLTMYALLLCIHSKA